MNIFTLIGIEFKKIRRSKIMLIFLLSAIVLWLPSVLNADLNFKIQDIGITPEHNFLIQGFMGVAWFIYPACMVVTTLLLYQTERGNNGMIKMLSLPLTPAHLCLAKFTVLLSLSCIYILIHTVMYYISAAISTYMQSYNFLLSPVLVGKTAGLIWLVSIPMLSIFWLLASCIQTPIFSIGIGLASQVPTVLLINTRLWFTYPFCYPLFIVTQEYSRLATNFDIYKFSLIPWLPTAVLISAVCLTLACCRFGQAERR